MASDQIDSVIGHLMELKKQKLQLELKEEEIRKYVNLLLTRKSNDYDQSFMIYSYDTDKESIEIIGRHLMEFSEMIYDHHYLVIARKEINRNFGIYLMPFEDDCKLETTLESIEHLIERKRQESENETYLVPSKRIVPEMKMMTSKMTDVDKNIEDIKIENILLKKEMETHSNQMKARLYQLWNEVNLNLNPAKSKELKIERFYEQKNLSFIRNSSKILKRMCMRLSVKNDGDVISREPPFNNILSMEDKQKELIGYFDLLQKNLDGSTEETEKQINIREWMSYNWQQLLYKPATSGIEEWRKEMEQRLKVMNTIGTVCHLLFNYDGKDEYFFFCLANSKIICWNCGKPKEEAFKNVHKNLKDVLQWDKNAKFATDMEVSDDLSDYFVHVSTDEIMKISNNQKVMEWMTNNFESLKYSFKERHHHSFPAIYTLALKYFEECIE